MTNGKRRRGTDLAVDDHLCRASGGPPTKRFQCDFDGCGKCYSRAEHLSRHQLNHAPREIFRCEFPSCDRWFVRQDLCTRHYERHFQDPEQAHLNNDAANRQDSLQLELALPGSAKKRRVGRPKLSEKKLLTPHLARANIDPPLSGDTRREASPVATGVATAVAPSGRTEYQIGYDTSNIAINGQAPHPSSPAAIEPAIMGQHADRARRDTVDSLNGSSVHNNHSLSIGHNGMVGASQTPGLFPNYHDQFSDSPGSARQDEFTNWLFDDLQNFYSGITHIGLQSHIGVADQANDFYAAPFPDSVDSFTMPALSRQPSVRYDQQLAPLGEYSWLSEARWRQLIDFIRLLFIGNGNPRGRFGGSSILDGDLEAEDHVLTLRLMNVYIATYWQSYHEQMPILHKPTFSADEAPDLLILAVMMIGAAHLPTSMGEYIKDNAHQFATFVAWHLRWHVFMHDDFHPPAKLWVFQALILLEVYEKLKATRFLHERANLHNATTINLIRRGTALVDASAIPDMEGGGMTPKEWWDRWVTVEATRRAAFAAFLIDASHGALFGHSNVMVAQEIQLPLPCDDALWSATSPSEVGRVEASLYANNVRPLTFLHGLKRILSGRKVRANAFGRMVLLAGLQSVSWNMRQREKVSNLGRGLGTPEVWRQTLTKAFDFWKKDFDEDFSHRQRAFMAWQNSGAVADSKTIAEYASAMHHLGHLAMHVDIIEAQILAGAGKVVSRSVTESDRERVSRKMSHWRHTPGADIAFQHAVQLLLDYIPVDSETEVIPHYSIADDCLTIRPWTLYYAALTAWCYVFVEQNPNEQMSAASSDSSGAMDSQRVSPEREGLLIPALKSPPLSSRTAVQALRVQRNASTMTYGLPSARPELGDRSALNFGPVQLSRTLRALERTLRQSRWELLQEAAERLRKALELLTAANST